MPDPIPTDPPPAGPRWAYRCQQCGRTAAATPEDVSRHVWAGWPKCCALPMTLSITPGAPDPGPE